MGDPPSGTDYNTIMYGALFNTGGELEHRLDRLTSEEGEVVVGYLAQLVTLETAILDAVNNLDADGLAGLMTTQIAKGAQAPRPANPAR